MIRKSLALALVATGIAVLGFNGCADIALGSVNGAADAESRMMIITNDPIQSKPAMSLTGDYYFKDSFSFAQAGYLLTSDGSTAMTFAQQRVVNNYGSYWQMYDVSGLQNKSHWKMMFFANGSAAAYDGINLSKYSRIAFQIASNVPVVLNFNVGGGDDTGYKGFAPYAVPGYNQWQTVVLDISSIPNRTDINSLLWMVCHKDYNPSYPAGTEVKVLIDDILLVP